MPNIASLLKDEISRLSRKEVRRHSAPATKATTRHRRQIAALNRKVTQLERALVMLARKLPGTSPAAASDETAPKYRFVAKGLQSHRNRLGLSAADFGKLIGVSAQSVYNWEHGQSVPRRRQLAKLAALRAIGKREASRRLKEAAGAKSAKRRKR
jgi:DNA-binding transcriptional regulator YiaG